MTCDLIFILNYYSRYLDSQNFSVNVLGTIYIETKEKRKKSSNAEILGTNQTNANVHEKNPPHTTTGEASKLQSFT